LRWRFRIPDHVFANRGFRDLDAELEQLAVNSGRSPTPTLSRLNVRISSRVSLGTQGCPACPCRTFQVQYQQKPRRCQSITVAGLTIKAPHAIEARIGITRPPRDVDPRFSAWAWDSVAEVQRSGVEGQESPFVDSSDCGNTRERTLRTTAIPQTSAGKAYAANLIVSNSDGISRNHSL
jgi:hypothetical protein